jgi:predicted DNA-binding helix-hairpin-helix protein
MLLRVPGLGPKIVNRILAARRWRTLRLADVERLVASPKRVKPFLLAPDWRPGAELESVGLGTRLVTPPAQLSLF